MALDEEIRNRFLTDSESILKSHLDDLEGMFRFHEDGTIELRNEYREMSPENQILLYLIARRYQSEGGMSEGAGLPYKEIYSHFPEKDDSTVRGYFMNLRKDGLARNGENGNELVVERLPEAIERIEDAVRDN